VSDVATYSDARERIDRIKAHVTAAWSDIVAAYRNRDWVTLGYADWDALCAEEFGGARIALPADDRRAVVADLRGAGMSTRAIASAVGVSKSTVAEDVRLSDSGQSPDTVTSLDGRQRPATQPAKVTTTTRTTEATKVERTVDLATGEVLEDVSSADAPAAEGVRSAYTPATPSTLPVIPITEEQAEALDFVRRLLDAPIPKLGLENPVSIISSRIRKPDQVIQPWMFGHGETKATCLWLKGLPKLVPTNIVEGREPVVHHMPPGPDRWKNRSRTYQGIADAMAQQWGGPC